MHPRNPHGARYNFQELSECSPDLKIFVTKNKYGDESIDFANPLAVKALNRALLKKFYQVDYWDIPEGFLCPPIPGRADALHYIADLIERPNGSEVHGLDIGVGANCIYPLIGHAHFGWNFVGSDCDSSALKSAQKILDQNKLINSINLRFQKNSKSIFKDIIEKTDQFDFTICNPPFHESAAEAMQGSMRKWKNLGKEKTSKLNFGGQSHELWTEGGEKAFILTMIKESVEFSEQCQWFTTLVSKEANLPILTKTLNNYKTVQTKILNMKQGQKRSRLLVWSFKTS
jgi:23S rRNA (adenine1618-N6)-methyltransferase